LFSTLPAKEGRGAVPRKKTPREERKKKVNTFFQKALEEGKARVKKTPKKGREEEKRAGEKGRGLKQKGSILQGVGRVVYWLAIGSKAGFKGGLKGDNNG